MAAGIQRAAETSSNAYDGTVRTLEEAERGKGFGVVAAEIEKLAARSAKSAEQVAERTERIRSGITSAASGEQLASAEGIL